MLLKFIVASLLLEAFSQNIDSNGYIIFCPCMGRFGNQADQFLGALNFAKQLNRTLVLPHWIDYRNNKFGTSEQIPFNQFFKIEPLTNFHKVILMNDFMSDVAPVIWPVGERAVFCYQSRDFAAKDKDAKPDCNAKEGNPFGPFWDKFGVDFDRSEFFGPLHYSDHDVSSWLQKYPSDKWPVLAFTGAPAIFPVSKDNALLHKFLEWNEDYENRAEAMIDQNLPRPYVGVHLRIGSDWASACKHIREDQPHHLFASPQCLGSKFEYGTPTLAMCMPSVETVLSDILEILKSTEAKSVFVARDDSRYDKQIKDFLDELGLKYFKLEDDPMMDLCMLARSDHFIGNCISTFSAFPARERAAKNKPTSFWAFKPLKAHDEL